MTKKIPWTARGPVPTDVDAVIIGAGLGGLMAATELAARGRRVCVLEAHSQPGGYAHAFRRKGYNFDVSLHHLGGLLRPGEITRRHLEALGVFADLEVVPRRTLLTIDFPDERISLGAEDPLSTLCERFPSEATKLRNLVGHVADLREALTSEDVDAQSLELKGRYRDACWDDVVRSQLRDPKLIALLGQLWMYVGLSPKRAAANFWAKVFGSFFIDKSAHIPRAGLTAAFCRRLDALGSSVHSNRAVASVETESGKATGVVLENGDRISAPLVISNANPYQTFLKLLPQSATSAAFRFRLQKMEPSLSAYVMFCGLDRAPSELGIPAGNYMAYRGTDLEAAYARVIDHDLDDSDWAMTNYEGVDDDPAGSKLSFFELTPAGQWLDLDDGEYRRRKAEVEQRLFDKYCARFERLREHVVVRELGTPRTMTRYTRNHAGAIYGFAQTPNQANTLRLGARTPIAGLFMTGAWSRPGGGYEGAMLSGMESARAALGDAWNEARVTVPRAAPHLSLVRESKRVAKQVPAESARTFLGSARVHYVDTDATEHVYHATYLRFVDEAREEALRLWLRAVDPSAADALGRVKIERMDVRYMNAASLGDRLTIELSIDEFDDRSIELRERVKHEDRLLVEASTRVSLLAGDARPLAVPAALERWRLPRRRPPLQVAPIDVDDGDEPPFGRFPTRVFHGDLDAQGNMTFESALRLLERARYEAMEDAMGELFDDLIATSRARVYRMVVAQHALVPHGTELVIETGAHVTSKHRSAALQRIRRADNGANVLSACVEILGVDERGSLALLPEGLEDRFRAARERYARANTDDGSPAPG